MHTGLQAGNAHEYVYENAGAYTLSDLDWPLMPAAYWGLSARLEASEGFGMILRLHSGLPTKTGTITDSDYLNRDGVLTHFSAHDAWLEEATMADLTLAWKLPIGGGWAFSPVLGFRFDSLQWSAQDGYTQHPSGGSPGSYSPWTDNREKVSVHGKAITYLQYWYLPYLGLKFDWQASDDLKLRLLVNYGPYVIANTIDNHFFRDLTFYDYMAGGFYLGPALGGTWQFSESLGLDVAVSWQGGWSDPGTSYSLEVGTGGTLESRLGKSEKAAGTSLQYFELDFGLVMTVPTRDAD